MFARVRAHLSQGGAVARAIPTGWRQSAGGCFGAARAVGLWLLGRRSFLHRQIERRVLREDILVIAAELGVQLRAAVRAGDGSRRPE